MYIRPLTRADLPSVGQITNTSFKDDDLFSYIWPRQEDFPEDLARYHMLRLRTRLVNARQHCFVAVTEEGDAGWTGVPEIAGYAIFGREGEDEGAERWVRDSWFKKFERHLLSWEAFYFDKFVDRVSDRARADAYGEVTGYDYYETMKPRWHLALIAVSVAHQRRGVGALLLDHGLRFADEEGLPMTLEASTAGRRLYLKSGFRIVDEAEIGEGLAVTAMVYEPAEKKGVWLENFEDERAEVKGRIK